MVEELLQKAKKPELVKFTKEVLGMKIPTSEKKDVFYREVLKDIRSKKENADFQKYIEYFKWNLTVKDIKHHVTNQDIFKSLAVITKKINQLYYEKSKAKTKDEQKKIMHFIGKLYDLRNIALVKLYDLGLILLVGVINIESECIRHRTVYVDTVTGKELDTKRLMLFPNMKYCRMPRKNQTLDLNNIEFLGEYKEENSKKIINKNFILSIDGKEYTIPESFMIRSKKENNFNELPIRPYEPKKSSLVPIDIDEIEYKKSSYILHKFLEKQLSDRAEERKKKAEIKVENKKKMEELVKAKAERKAKLEAKKKAKAERMAKKSNFKKRYPNSNKGNTNRNPHSKNFKNSNKGNNSKKNSG